MGDAIKGFEFLGIAMPIASIIIAVLLIMHIIVKILEFKGKIVPEFVKVFAFHSKKKQEKQEKQEILQALKEVKQLLNDVNQHYSEDNITKRNKWMQGVDNRAVNCGNQMTEMKDALLQVTQALNTNTRMTEEMFVQSSRDRIIDFSTKVGDENAIVSQEEFHRIFKVYDKYELFLAEHQMTNGEVDIAYKIIKDAYAYRLTHHSFLEHLRGYDK